MLNTGTVQNQPSATPTPTREQGPLTTIIDRLHESLVVQRYILDNLQRNVDHIYLTPQTEGNGIPVNPTSDPYDVVSKIGFLYDMVSENNSRMDRICIQLESAL